MSDGKKGNTIDMEEIKVSITTPIYPTEDAERVKEAVKKLFPKAKVNISGPFDTYDRVEVDLLVCEGGLEILEKFRKRIREQRILDTARSLIYSGGMKFSLNKQSALVEMINFKEKAPLGTINIEIEDSDNKLIDWLAPETEEGSPVDRNIEANSE